jgi:ribonuclease HI
VWVVNTDSEYVVKGMTKWLPTWKVGGPVSSVPSADLVPLQSNSMRASNGRRPDNLDLFLRLESLITDRKQNKGIAICFWWIPRVYNTIADGLAEEGAKTAQVLRKVRENNTML